MITVKLAKPMHRRCHALHGLWLPRSWPSTWPSRDRRTGGSARSPRGLQPARRLPRSGRRRGRDGEELGLGALGQRIRAPRTPSFTSRTNC